MASSLLLLIDDIATLLDDVSVMTKVAAKKTAGVLGDDLALNAEQVTGVQASRELPVVWAVAKGSMLNKVILVPAALVISVVLPPLVTVLLMLGGAFLCFEGAEKLVHKLFHGKDEHAGHDHPALSKKPVDLVAFEKEKIKGAVRTDFVLSAEIVVITLGTVASEPLGKKLAVLAAISAVMTVGVYGLVAGIVKLDDAGLALVARESSGAKATGRAILWAAPLLMKLLSLAGTVAMFLVGGGILVHGVAPIHHFAEGLAKQGGVVGMLGPTAVNGGVGLVAGAALAALFLVGKRIVGKGGDASKQEKAA